MSVTSVGEAADAERAMAAEWGVAYLTIRRAMAELRERGLIVSVQGDLPDSVAVALRHDVGLQVSSGGIRGVILDVSGVMIVDSYLARVLTEIAAESGQTVAIGSSRARSPRSTSCRASSPRKAFPTE